MSCCKSCTFCARAFPKERIKSRVSSLLCSKKSQIKICEKCFLCHSIVLCPNCNKCQKCYTKPACRGQTSKLLAYLAGSGCRSESSTNPERGLHPPLSGPAKTHKVSHSHKLLCQSPQEPLPAGGITSAYRQKHSGTGAKSKISRVFQLTVFGPKTQQQVEGYTRSEQTKSLPQGGEIQNGDTETIRTSLQQGEWVTLIDFKDSYFHIPIQEQSNKYQRFHVESRTYQFKALPFGLSTAPMEFTVVAKEVKLMAIHKGIRIHQYLDDWLVRARSHQICLPTYPNSSESVTRFRLAGECRKIRAGTQTGLRLCRLPVRPQVWSGPTNTGPVAEPSRKDTRTAFTTSLSGSSCP